MVKNLFRTLFLHSPKRTFFVIGGFIVILALPLTILLTQQSQDVRQRAAGETIPITDADYIDKYSIASKEGYDAVFDPSQGGWVYVPVDTQQSYQTGTAGETNPTGETFTATAGETNLTGETFTAMAGETNPTFSQTCIINATATSASDNCTPPYRCEPRTGYGNICVELPQTATYDSNGNLISPGSLQVGDYCRYDNECQTLICYYAPGWVGVSSCINPLADNQACHKNSECQSGYCSIYPGADLGLCKTQCSPSNCSGTCNPQTNECSAPIPTATPTPLSTNTGDGTTCSSNGVKSVTYDKMDCSNSETFRGATITCNDGYTTNVQVGMCLSKNQWESTITQACSSHTTCTPWGDPPPPGSKPDGSICEFNYECQSSICLVAPDNTKKCSGMPSPPQSLICDPNGDGKIDLLDFNVWRDEYLTKISNTTKSACFAVDKAKVDILDFNVWRDIYILKKTNAF